VTVSRPNDTKETTFVWGLSLPYTTILGTEALCSNEDAEILEFKKFLRGDAGDCEVFDGTGLPFNVPHNEEETSAIVKTLVLQPVWSAGTQWVRNHAEKIRSIGDAGIEYPVLEIRSQSHISVSTPWDNCYENIFTGANARRGRVRCDHVIGMSPLRRPKSEAIYSTNRPWCDAAADSVLIN